MSEIFNNSTVIKNISYDQGEIIRNIIKLHLNGKDIDCDITYSKGNFYKNTGVTTPKHIFDKFPQSDNVKELGDKIDLPDESIDSIMVDLPFVIGGVKKVKDYKDGSCIIGKRFEQFRSIKELQDTYKQWIGECYRVLKPNGVLIFKCQDTVSGGKQYLIHVNSIVWMNKVGFYIKDIFNLLAKNRIISSKHSNQQHARKYNSYFIVAVKKNEKNITYLE